MNQILGQPLYIETCNLACTDLVANRDFISKTSQLLTFVAFYCKDAFVNNK